MRGKFGYFLSLIILVGTIFQSSPVQANITSCADAEVTPHTVAPNSTTDFSIRIRNTDVNSILWLDLNRPTGHFILTNAVFDGWETDVESNRVLLTGGSLANNQTLTGTITAQANNVNTTEDNWAIRVSDNSSGTSPFFCSGSLGVSISGELEDQFPPNFSNLRLSGLTHNSVIVAWETDEPATSVVDYGVTEDYGQTKNSSQLATNHSLILTGLTSDTGYFFQVSGADANSNVGTGESGTFLTAVAPPPGAITSSGTSNTSGTITQNQVQTVVPLTPAKESTPPKISLTTQLASIYKTPPEISGIASDNDVLAKVEYSINGGISWQSVDKVAGLGSKKATFSFVSKVTNDGNYEVLARAIDASLNVGTSERQTLIIDTGAPIVGGVVVMAGANLLTPTTAGEIISIVGLEQRITVNAIGGPTEIALLAEPLDNKDRQSQRFTLTKSWQTGLWSGVLSFQSAGQFRLVADSIDGAKNTSVKAVGTVRVLPPGLVVNNRTKTGIEKMSVSLYVFEPTTQSWRLWNGTPYGQKNPQLTTKEGRYQLFVPAGKYYLKLTGPAHQSAQSQIFELDQPMPLSTEIAVQSRPAITLGKLVLRLPRFSASNFTVETTFDQPPSVETGKPALPAFALTKTDGGTVRDVDLLGRPTLLTLLNSWAPSAREQLPILDDVAATYKEVNVAPVFLLESVSALEAYKKIGGYSVELVSDKEGMLAGSLNSNAVPTHYLVNRKGIIQKVIVGVLSKEELFAQLINL